MEISQNFVAISEYMNFMTVNKLVGKFIDKQSNAMKIRVLTSIAELYNVFFSLKISALDIVSGQKSARCNQSFSGESARD